MRNLLIASLAALALAGCGSSSSGDDATVKDGSGVALNPGGKPQNADDSARASAMQKQGETANAQMQAGAGAEAAAKAKTGGK